MILRNYLNMPRYLSFLNFFILNNLKSIQTQELNLRKTGISNQHLFEILFIFLLILHMSLFCDNQASMNMLLVLAPDLHLPNRYEKHTSLVFPLDCDRNLAALRVLLLLFLGAQNIAMKLKVFILFGTFPSMPNILSLNCFEGRCKL